MTGRRTEKFAFSRDLVSLLEIVWVLISHSCSCMKGVRMLALVGVPRGYVDAAIAREGTTNDGQQLYCTLVDPSQSLLIL